MGSGCVCSAQEMLLRRCTEVCPLNGSFLIEIVRKFPPPPTFKKPLKPPLLLFEHFVQSEPCATNVSRCKKNFDPNQLLLPYLPIG